MNLFSQIDDGLGTADFVTVALYLSVTAGIALYFSRQKGSAEQFFLGGRRMPWFAVGLSLIATLMSTISYLATPGEAIRTGVGMMFAYLAIPFSMAVVLLLWVPFFMRLKLTSAYEYLELRFGLISRLIAASFFILMRLGWMGVVVYTSSKALARMLQTESTYAWVDTYIMSLGSVDSAEVQTKFLFLIIGMVGFFATLYTAVGGFRAVIWTDVLQFLTMFTGAILTVGYVIYSTGTGPIDWFIQAKQATAQHTSPPLFSLDLTVRITIFGAILHGFFWTICTHGSDQVVLQRYFSTTSAKSARRSYITNAIADLSVGFLLALCGFALLAFYMQNPTLQPADFDLTKLDLSEVKQARSLDDVFPYFIAHELPDGVGGLILAALIAAAMSSVDSGVNSVSAVITTDFFERFFPRGSNVISKLTLARILTFVVGATATGVAYWVTIVSANLNILDLMPKSFNMFLGPMAGMFFVGMFLPRCGSRSVVGGVIGGMLVSFTWSYWTEIASNVGFLEKQFGTTAPTFTLSTVVPLAVTFGLSAFLSFIIEPKDPQHGRDYTWRAVMQRAEISSTDNQESSGNAL